MFKPAASHYSRHSLAPAVRASEHASLYGPQERDVLERAVHAIAEQEAKAVTA
jgi:hypothetical protein